MDLDLLIIDDFFNDVDKVIKESHCFTYVKPESGTWNGSKSKDALSIAEQSYIKLSEYLPITPLPWEKVQLADKFWGQASVGSCSLLRNNESDTVHFHLRSGLYAAVIYLCEPPNDIYFHGISFYKNIYTGKKYCECGDEKIGKYREQGKSLSHWHEWNSVRLRKNRAVIFNARFFHRASDGFGENQKDGRLVNIYSFDEKL